MTDATESDHNLLGKVSLPAGSCETFDMGYVDYEAWEKFSKSEITYITREKKSEVASISAEGSPSTLTSEAP